MSKSVKLVVSIYLAIVAIICCAYLVMLLVGSFQGNDMRGAVLDSDNTKNIENVDYINNSSQSSELKTTESSDIPQGSQSSNDYKLNNVSSLKDDKHHTWTLEQSW